MSLTFVRPRALAAIALVVGVVLVAIMVVVSQSKPRQIHISASYAASSLDDLLEQAEAIAILQPTGEVVEHWNAADGRHWGMAGVDAFIYRDVTVRVVSALAGELPATLVVRDVGGVADGFDLDLEGAGQWAKGLPYFVFLRHADFPTREGSEQAWTAVRLAQGMFSRGSGGWINVLQGLRIEDADVPSLAAKVGGAGH